MNNIKELVEKYINFDNTMKKDFKDLENSNPDKETLNKFIEAWKAKDASLVNQICRNDQCAMLIFDCTIKAMKKSSDFNYIPVIATGYLTKQEILQGLDVLCAEKVLIKTEQASAGEIIFYLQEHGWGLKGVKEINIKQALFDKRFDIKEYYFLLEKC